MKKEGNWGVVGVAPDHLHLSSGDPIGQGWNRKNS